MIIPDAVAVSDLSDGASTVPEAQYNARVAKAEYIATPKTADAKGPYIRVQWTITGPGDGKHVGRAVFNNYSLTGDGSFRLKELLKLTNHPDDFKLEDDQQLVGLECGLIVTEKKVTEVEKATKGWRDQNVVRKHVPLVNA